MLSIAPTAKVKFRLQCFKRRDPHFFHISPFQRLLAKSMCVRIFLKSASLP
jgi:hypothetical protein